MFFSKPGRVHHSLALLNLLIFEKIKQCKDLLSSIPEVVAAIRCPIIPSSPTAAELYGAYSTDSIETDVENQCIKLLIPYIFRGKFNNEMHLLLQLKTAGTPRAGFGIVHRVLIAYSTAKRKLLYNPVSPPVMALTHCC